MIKNYRFKHTCNDDNDIRRRKQQKLAYHNYVHILRRSVELHVSTFNQRRNTTNVFAYITGSVEPGTSDLLSLCLIMPRIHLDKFLRSFPVDGEVAKLLWT